jgi:membrane associated rhomboid family serine protease
MAINVVIYLGGLFYPGGQREIILAYGSRPAEMFSLQANHIRNVFISMFLHGGVLHVSGNMLYLWIFGNNIEDRLGHFRYLVFYLLCGVVAAYGHALSEPSSMIPMIGASGAIAGILGAYLLLYPHAKVHTIIFIGFFIDVIMLPAVFVIGFWAVLQILSAIISKGALSEGGVAWFAHVGGFVFGIATIKLWLPKRRKLWK